MEDFPKLKDQESGFRKFRVRILLGRYGCLVLILLAILAAGIFLWWLLRKV